MKKIRSIGEFGWLRNKILAREIEGKTRVNICMTGCRAYGAAEVRDAIEEEIKKNGLTDKIELRSKIGRAHV